MLFIHNQKANEEEILDVIDENDKVIGQAPRTICHKLKKLHRSISFIIFEDNTKEKVLIQKRSFTKDIQPGKLDFLGGHLASGDSYFDAAKRELHEEMFTNTKLPQGLEIKELFKLRKNTDDDPEIKMVYQLIYNGPFQPNHLEVADWYFKDIDELLKDMNAYPEKYSETPRLLIEEYRKRFRM